jgi:hypothetical protein
MQTLLFEGLRVVHETRIRRAERIRHILLTLVRARAGGLVVVVRERRVDARYLDVAVVGTLRAVGELALLSVVVADSVRRLVSTSSYL